MSSIISAGTSVNTAVSITGDTSGSLALATNNGITAVTIDTAQNVGIGATPVSFAKQTIQFDSVGGGITQALALIAYGGSPTISFRGSGGTAASPSATTTVCINLIGSTTSDGTNYFNTSAIQSNMDGAFTTGSHPTHITFATTPSGSTSRSERVRIDSNGNVGIATTAPEYRLDVTSTDNVTTTTAMSVQNNSRNYGLGIGAYSMSNRNIGGTVTTVDYTFDIGGDAIFKTANTERARIDSGGVFYVGKTANTASVIGWALNGNGTGGATFTLPATNEIFVWDNTSTAGTAIIDFRTGNISKGRIQWNNTSTTYSTSSDYRLKDTIAPMTGALAKVSQLKPVTYKWKVDGSDGQGFIAHELDEVVPGCVTGEKDAIDAEGKPQYQGIDTSFLVATLTAAIQELKAIVDAQGAEIAALKGTP